ncbi:MAG: AlpA family phage regulatory protein [Arenicellales bacterium]|jgi:predicted DNA-binding transcriptional regulator AlpA|nr:AlpA family phage regulatory protein [Arenicellales bacterium]
MRPIVTRLANIYEITGCISRNRAYELEKTDPDFPKRIRIGGAGGTTGWLTSALEEYLTKKAGIQDRITSADPVKSSEGG